jgi:photosystem II biogenesis protein Psp29
MSDYSIRNKIRTVSDTKRDFYKYHTRPINSVYRQVVEELLVEMHLLSVNSTFQADPIYVLGVVTSFDRFMEGYQPESDKISIFSAICQAIGANPQEYRQDAENVLNVTRKFTFDQLIAWISEPTYVEDGNKLIESIKRISDNPNFKYSRLFGIGLYTMLEQENPENLKDAKQRDKILKQVSEVLNLPFDKIQKDLDLYRSNLEKMSQILLLMKDVIESDRKKREKRQLEN